MKMVKTFLTLLFVVASMQATAQTIIKDADNGQPVAQATVYDDATFEVIGVTGPDGAMPELGDAKRIRVSHIAYVPQTMEVAQLASELKLAPATYSLSEVVAEKEKAYCLRLKCYHRHYMPNAHSKFGKELGSNVPPLIDCYDELCEIFIFVDGKTPTMRMPSAARNLLGETFMPGPKVGQMKRLTMAPRSGQYCTQKTDAQRKTVETFFDALAPDKERTQNLIIFSYTISHDTEYALYRQADNGNIGASGLLTYSTVRHLSGLTPMFPSTEIDAWTYDDYFPYEIEYLAKDQYKAAERQLKGAMKQPAAKAEAAVAAKVKELNIPALSDDIQQKIEASRLWWQKQRK